MDLRQLEYIVAIEKYENITKAAAKLYITSSALNQQLLKLEKDIGMSLFHRSQRRLIPTNAGRIYLDTAKKMLAMKKNTYEQLQDISECHSGLYHIGLTFDHGTYIFSKIYPKFHGLFPNILLRCYQTLVPDIHDMLLKHQLDLALILIGNYDIYHDLEFIPLSSENLVLGIPVTHPAAKGADLASAPYKTIRLEELRGDNFATAPKQTSMRKELIDPLFEATDVEPNIILESSINRALESVTASGICNCIIPQSQISNRTDIAWFYLPENPRFHFGAAYPRDSYLSRAMKYFIDESKKIAKESLDFPLR